MRTDWDDDVDTMTTAEIWQERWRAYKKPIMIWLAVLLVAFLFGPEWDCTGVGGRACSTSEDMTAMEKFIFTSTMFYAVFIFPAWVSLISLGRKYAEDGHLD
ncbi:hypothetical protein [Conchiformibius kuhniae]|uniref:Uncharacterized protein n=1 Tax=Conchiformibius kuhniae TaxID=211502 RepID=A0A8T9N0D2_9NEIS|nr:hypothetical protein [Conchiformibius kuhniae]UOP05463.1 hypothetical protein LVJ77_04735 [Conchiformibius kuhniae]